MKKGIIYASVSAFIYGFTPIIGFYTYGMGNDPYTLAFLRNVLVFPIVIVMLIVKRIDMRVSLNDLMKLGITSILGSVSTTVLLYSSYQYVGVGTTTAVHFLYPLFIHFSSRYFFRIKKNTSNLLPLLIALISVFMFCDFRNSQSFMGLGLALLSGLSYGLYIMLIEKWHLTRLGNLVFTFYITFIASLVFLLLNNKVFVLNFYVSIDVIGLAMIIGIFASFIGIILLKKSVALIGSNLVSIINYIEPLSAILLGWLILGETMNIFKVIGIIGIIISLILLHKRKIII